MTQGEFNFDDAPEPEPEPPGPERPHRKTVDERFAEWIEGHGATVYESFVAIACQVKATGRARFGGKAIAEVARYRRVIEGKDSEGYMVNNSYVSLMVRRLIDERPEFSGWFELRHRRGDSDS